MSKEQRELEEIKRGIEIEEKTSLKGKEIKCYWCEKEIRDAELYPDVTKKYVPKTAFILDDYFFMCVQHGTIFCEFHAKNYDKKEIKADEAPRCPNLPRIDCIYEKRIINLEEVKENDIH
jgi:hypothetical protein